MSKVQSPKSAIQSSSIGGELALEQRPSSGKAQSSILDVGQSVLQPAGSFALTVADLRKSFLLPTNERLEVLKGISFLAHAGESLAITGKSGSGKTTLLHLLGGLEKPDHGSVTAGGFCVDSAGRSELVTFRNQHIGFVFQFHHLLNDLSALENVTLPLRIRRLSQREAMRQAYEILESAGIDRRTADSVVTHLSGGEQQRVAVCRALITCPSLVLADEPTGNLDEAAGAQIAQLLLSYVQTHSAILILATHNLGLAQLCHRHLLLADGRATGH